MIVWLKNWSWVQTPDDMSRVTIEFTPALVQRLIDAQFPEYSHLPIKPVALSGWDNRTFHLGDALTVRLPSAKPYAAQVEKEQAWLPKLGPQLPIPISAPVAKGQPSEDLPWFWSIYQWLPGETVFARGDTNLNRFAVDLAAFLKALQKLDTKDAPTPGRGSSLRGGPVTVWAEATLAALVDLRDQYDTQQMTKIWQQAEASTNNNPPVWVHGDVSPGNLLVDQGKLCGVIDFGQLTAGDPACDMVIAWTLFDADSRQRFREELGVSDATWARGKGWALWKALIVQAKHISSNAVETALAPRVLTELIEDEAAGD